MKQNSSKKHHYLPRHYLKGFTNNDGSFFAYDKQTDKIFLTSPDSAFFENDLNTVVFPSGQSSTFIEDQYTEIERQCWSSLDKIRASNSKTPISFEDKEFLFLFLASLYWRLPINTEMTEKLSESAFTNTSPVDYFKLKSKTGKTIPVKVIEAIRGSSAFKKAFRLMLPFAPFLKDKNWGAKLRNWRFLYTENQKRHYIVGDNPILTTESMNQDPVNVFNEFVFPVSGNILLVNLSTPLGKGLPAEFIINYNMAIFERARRFVVCPDENLLKALIEHYKIYTKHQKEGMIVDEMFKTLSDKESVPYSSFKK